jgi:uncharacterized membrane protein YeaQ/YmgE (transglycosylase-associated protein family)
MSITVRAVNMTILELVVLAIIAAVAGAIGQAIAGYSLGGCVISAIVGYIGALIGFWLARSLGLPEPLVVTVGDQTFPILWSIIGSTIFTLIVGVLTRRRRPVVY